MTKTNGEHICDCCNNLPATLHIGNMEYCEGCVERINDYAHNCITCGEIIPVGEFSYYHREHDVYYCRICVQRGPIPEKRICASCEEECETENDRGWCGACCSNFENLIEQLSYTPHKTRELLLKCLDDGVPVQAGLEVSYERSNMIGSKVYEFRDGVISQMKGHIDDVYVKGGVKRIRMEQYGDVDFRCDFDNHLYRGIHKEVALEMHEKYWSTR